MRSIATLFALTALAACGQSAEPTAAERLDNAAEQSTPAAANVLENAADSLRGQDPTLPPSDPNSPVQNAMQRAGQAQIGEQGNQTTPSQQAKPHRAGDPVPPQVTTSPTPAAR